MRAALATLALLFLPVAAAGSEPAYRIERRVDQSSCGELVGDFAHEWHEARLDGASVWVDLDARAWQIDEPAVYRVEGDVLHATLRHRVGDGAVRVETRVAPGAGHFELAIHPEPAGEFSLALAQYLPGVELPCRAVGSISLTPAPATGRRAADAATVYDAIRRATELLYDQHFARADAALRGAQEIAPDSDTLRWMRARVAYLEGEALPAGDRAGRLERFTSAERLADEAVALDPEGGEGWLWRGVARGRITTTQAGLSLAMDVLLGDRGPAWTAHCFERAIELGPEYTHFGFTAAGDARLGAAQVYRLLPGGVWARPLLGVTRDLDRSVALAGEALALQPQRIEYAKELGVSLLCRAAVTENEADAAEARRVLRRALALPVRTSYERTDRRHVAELLGSDAERACGYSRDAWDEGATLVAESAL